MQRSDQEKEAFYENLGVVLDRAKHDKIIILGDLNVRVGIDWLSWLSVIGKHGVGNMNSNGLMLFEFCTRFQFIIMGTMFQPKKLLRIHDNIYDQSTRSCPCQQKCKTTHHNNESKFTSRLLHRS